MNDPSLPLAESIATAEEVAAALEEFLACFDRTMVALTEE